MYELPALSGLSLAWELRRKVGKDFACAIITNCSVADGNRVPGKSGTNERKLIELEW